MKGEDKLQSECVKLFRYMHQPLQWKFLHIPNGGKRNAFEAVKLKAMGTLAGAWDNLLLVPKGGKSGLFVEFKHGRNKLTDNQKKFKQENEQDYAFEICYTVDEFIKAINTYLS